MPVLTLTNEQAIELVKQLPATNSSQLVVCQKTAEALLKSRQGGVSPTCAIDLLQLDN